VSWLGSLSLPVDVGRDLEVETQFTIPTGKRPDIVIRSGESVTLVESKLRSGFGDTQIPDYLKFVGTQSGRRALILLTQRPEVVPPELLQEARRLGVALVPTRWQTMADHMGEPGEESLAGDFIQLLIREGLVKPNALSVSDWETWNAGYNVSLRIEALLAELDPHVARILPGAKARGGGSKFWTWRLWSTGSVDVGLAFLSAEWTDRPHTNPVLHCWVLNRESDEESTMAAVRVTASDRSKWTESEDVRGSYGMSTFGPAIARSTHEVLTADTFDGQVDNATAFVRDTVDFFRSRGYLPLGPA